MSSVYSTVEKRLLPNQILIFCSTQRDSLVQQSQLGDGENVIKQEFIQQEENYETFLNISFI